MEEIVQFIFVSPAHPSAPSLALIPLLWPGQAKVATTDCPGAGDLTEGKCQGRVQEAERAGGWQVAWGQAGQKGNWQGGGSYLPSPSPCTAFPATALEGINLR